MPEAPVLNRKAVLSFWLGLASLVLGPLTGIPGILLGSLALKNVLRNPSKAGGRGCPLAGIGLGLFGTLFVSFLCYVEAKEIFWPSVGSRVDRIFRDIYRERFHERQDGMWPVFRQITPNWLYRAADERWPFHDAMVPIEPKFIGRIFVFPGPSGTLIHPDDLLEAIEPIVDIGKPAIPHLLKWLRHEQWYVRCAAFYALEEISNEQHLNASQIRRRWYDEQASDLSLDKPKHITLE